MATFFTMKRMLISTIFILLTNQLIFSQNLINQSLSLGHVEERCGFDIINQTKMADPAYRQLVQEHNLMMAKVINQGQAKSGLVIPVVVHVLHKGEAVGSGTNISDAQILSAISNLNSVYANTFGSMPSVDMGVQFVMAARDPNCNATNGIVRVNASGVSGYSSDGCQLDGSGPGANETTLKDLSKWPTDKYMNFWIVSELGGNNGGCGVQGYASLPIGIDAYNGSVMMAGTFGYDPNGTQGFVFGACGGDNSTVIHEVGHFLDLYHTFEGGGDGVCPSPTETSCSTQNDFVCDTPPHMHYMTSNSSLYFSCANGHANECSSGNMDQVIHNIMNYTSCPDRFTAGQKTRVQACLASSRLSLTSSLGGTPPSGTYTAPIAAGCTPLTSGAGLSGGYAGITEVIFNDLISSSSSTNVDNPTNGYMNFTTSCLNVANVQAGQVYSLKVSTYFNTQKVKAWIDYNNNGVFTDAGEELTPSGGLTSTNGAQVTQSVTIPASPTLNTSLRMRIISETGSGPTSGSCHSCTYGQAEDYTVVITSTSLPASVSIVSSDNDNSICPNESVTFTATPTNGGSAPLYQWQVNGVNVGTNSTTATYTTTSLTSGQSVTCVMTSNLSGVTASPATSNAIVTTVVGVTPSVSIALTTGTNPSCAGENKVFTATPTNGGTTPTYDWKVDGVSTASTSTFTTSTLTSGQVVTCVMTSNNSCASPTTGTSNSITITLNSSTVPSVSIALTTGTNPTCAGENLIFTATPTNGGTTPTYDWKVDGVSTATTSTFSTTTLTSGQVISCVMTSNSLCSSPSTGTSNSITITTSSTVVPSVSIALTTGSNPTCPGENLVFTATPTNGGSTPTYDWQIDGVSTATTSTFTTSTLTSGQVVSCVMTSNSTCASPLTATSNSITVSVGSTVVPSVSIALTTGSNPSCAGDNLVFTATPTNGGTTPTYDWKVDGVSTATTSTFTSSTITSGQVVTCVITSSSACASPTTGTSNSITITRNPSVSPTISIAITSGSNPSTAGSPITFTATVTNEGTSPSFQWKVDGVDVGTNSSTFTTSSLTNNQTVTCVLTSNSPCANPLTVTSSPITVTISATPPPAPSGSSSQSFCAPATIANLAATGTSIQWYPTSSGGTALATSTSLINGSSYYATQTVSGVESTSRLTVTVTVTTVSAPTGVSPQNFCSSSTISNLVASGTAIQWFSTSTGGTALSTSTVLTNGVTYYASQTVGGCTSATRLSVGVSLGNTSAPTGSSSQTLCPNSTIANLSATGTDIQWYAASSGGTALASTTALTTGTTYYASQTVSGCSSSSRLAVTVAIGSTPAAPTGASPQNFCGTPTIADLVPNGSSIIWYPSASLGTALASTTALSNGSNYFAAQTNGSCESTTRLEVAVSINYETQTSLSSFPTLCLNDQALTLTQGSPIGGSYSGTGVSGGSFNPSTAGLGTFTITYSYTNVNLCTTTSTGSIIVDDCVSLSELNATQYLIYPNPSNGMLTISSNYEPIQSIQLIDNIGRLVAEHKISGLEKEVVLNLENYSEGIYTIQISSESSIVNSKITIKK